MRALRPIVREMKPARALIFILLLLCTRAEPEAAEENLTTEDKTATDTDTETETEKKEKTDEITEEKNVLVLHEKNFVRALSENKYLLVEFCKCSHLVNSWPIIPYV